MITNFIKFYLFTFDLNLLLIHFELQNAYLIFVYFIIFNRYKLNIKKSEDLFEIVYNNLLKFLHIFKNQFDIK